MKPFIFAVAIVAGATSISAFAQTSSPAQPSYDTAQAASTSGQWVPPYGQPTSPKTRAQVYQELVHAEQDGQMDYLNSTVYAHP